MHVFQSVWAAFMGATLATVQGAHTKTKPQDCVWSRQGEERTLEVVQDNLHSSPLLTSGLGPSSSAASAASSISSRACKARLLPQHRHACSEGLQTLPYKATLCICKRVKANKLTASFRRSHLVGMPIRKSSLQVPVQVKDCSTKERQL